MFKGRALRKIAAGLLTAGGTMVPITGIKIAGLVIVFGVLLFIADLIVAPLPEEHHGRWGAITLFIPAWSLGVLLFWTLLLSFNFILDESKVYITLFDAYEWNYKNATQENSEKRITIPLISLYKSGEYRLNIGVSNENTRFSLKEVRLHMYFPDVGLSVRPDGKWSARKNNREYFYKFGTISNNAGLGPNGALYIKFPHIGTYVIEYAISGVGLPGDLENFKIALFKFPESNPTQ